jgi:hypothetical protein
LRFGFIVPLVIEAVVDTLPTLLTTATLRD